MLKRIYFISFICTMLIPLIISASDVNQPSTPFSIQFSGTGSGISGVYRFNGPTESGPYIGLYIGHSSISSSTQSTFSTIGGWLGIRKQLNNRLYFAYGAEGYSNFGEDGSDTISNGYEAGPFISLHYYLSKHAYVTLFNNPIYISSEEIAGIATSRLILFAGGVGIGYQF